MAEQRPHGQGQKSGNTNDKKRKQPPHPTSRPADSHKRPKFDHRNKQRDARQLATQTSSTVFRNGELDVDKFVKAREYEIQALEEGMVRSRKALNCRAFQQVPKDLRRRTASHNVKRVPKRLRVKAQREMVDDNTPTVTARRRKLTRHLRLRQDVVKKLRAAGAKNKSDSNKAENTPVATRAPKVKKAVLSNPPLPKAKFRKRQIHKTWLPTHLFHAKRAHMSLPSKPLWRFSIPISPTVKSYRPTHRASLERGAVAWDMSYISTIGLEGRASSLESVLKGLKVGLLGDQVESQVWGNKGAKWRAGLRTLETFAFEREMPHALIAPITVIWNAVSRTSNVEEAQTLPRKLFIRVHPSAFLLLWEEIVRLATVAKPAISVEDLRFELGSIDIQGPGGTEALLGALWPSTADADADDAMAEPDISSVDKTWTSLAGLTDTSMLPNGALLGFNVQDPRLHFPPRTIAVPEGAEAQQRLLTTLASWPIDMIQQSPAIFERKSRITAGAALSSQKAINRRKALATPGSYPAPEVRDPKIPVLPFTTSRRKSGSLTESSCWTVLLPWKCVQPVWYSLMYYPLSTGQQPRLGGLDEIRQLAFEAGQPWFPADFPGTHAGWKWELQERTSRLDSWKRHPKSKRVNWEKVDLGTDKPGEIGLGWACDWQRLLEDGLADEVNGTENAEQTGPLQRPRELSTLSYARAQLLLGTRDMAPEGLAGALLTVRLSLVTRGVPQTCARIYRLPLNNLDLRRAWLALLPQHKKKYKPKNAPARLPKDAPAHVLKQRLAASLLEPPKVGDASYPRCPDEADLIGFVTTGNFNLSQGQGTGIGSILLTKVLADVQTDAKEGHLCIIRNAGTSTGRLARWEVAS